MDEQVLKSRWGAFHSLIHQGAGLTSLLYTSEEGERFQSLIHQGAGLTEELHHDFGKYRFQSLIHQGAGLTSCFR